MHNVRNMQYAQRPKQSAPDTDVVLRLALAYTRRDGISGGSLWIRVSAKTYE